MNCSHLELLQVSFELLTMLRSPVMAWFVVEGRTTVGGLDPNSWRSISYNVVVE